MAGTIAVWIRMPKITSFHPSGFAACWPGETIRPDSATNRLYVAISKLRKLGLHDVLRTGDDGYELAARVEVADD